MSLSRWLRDYLYIPLDGSRRGSTGPITRYRRGRRGCWGGLLLLTIEALGGDGSALFIYFQF